jgi:hypothetical protein
MMQESSVTFPSRSGHAARPTQQLGSSSEARPAASTASSAGRFFDKIGHAPLLAVIPLSQVEATTGVLTRNVDADICFWAKAVEFRNNGTPAKEIPRKFRLFISLVVFIRGSGFLN